MKVEHCRRCGAEIVWLKTASGKSMPVNVKVSAAGPTLKAPSEGDALFDHKKHESHFATCQFASEFRRPKVLTDANRPLDDESRFPIGKAWKGTRIKDVPAEHLLWWWDECGLWNEQAARERGKSYALVRDYIVENFSALEMDAPDRVIDHRPEKK